MRLPSRPGRALAAASATVALLAGCSAAGARSHATASPPSPSTRSSPSSAPTSGGPSGTVSASPTTSTPPAPAAPTPTTIPRQGGRIVVVGLGDSVTAATNCGCTDFVTQLARRLPPALGGSGAPVNLGVGGLTTVSLQSQLTSDAATRAALAHAGIVVVTIGANDLTPLIRAWLAGGCASGCVQPAVAAMGSRLSADLATVHGLVRAGARILVTDYWAVFQDGDVARATRGAAFLPWADGVTKRANAAICAAAGGVDATCVDLYAPFKGPAGDIDDTPLLSDDGDHPNAAGEAVITRALLAALR